MENENESQPSYSMYNFNEDKSFFVGDFDNDEKFWEHYFANRETIEAKCKQLDADSNWHMHRSGRETTPTIEPVRLVEPEHFDGEKNILIIDEGYREFVGKSALTEGYIHQITHNAEKEGRKIIVIDAIDDPTSGLKSLNNPDLLRELGFAAEQFKTMQNIPIIAPPPMVEIGGFTPPKTREQKRKEKRDNEKKNKKRK
jgi:hypothetical protein